MKNLVYEQSLINTYVDPGIEVLYSDIENGTSIATLNDANEWGASLSDGSVFSITVTRGSSDIDILSTTDSSTWVDMGIVGEYELSYQFSDDALHTTSISRTVSIVAPYTPEILLLGDATQVIPLNGVYVESGATVDGIQGVAEIVSNVDLSTVGEYTVSYNYTNAVGIIAETVNRTIIVFANAGPVITLVGDLDITIDLGALYVEPGYNAVDGRGDDISSSVKISSDLDASLGGSYTVFYSVNDSYGTSTYVTRSVTVSEYPDLDDVIVTSTSSATGSDVFQHGVGEYPVYSVDYSISNFTEITDIDNMIQNIYNILFQSPRDRMFNPVFGSRLNTRVFALMETGTSADVLTMLKEDIERFEPRVTVVMNESIVEMDPSNRKMIVALKVKVPSSDQLETVAFTVS